MNDLVKQAAPQLIGRRNTAVASWYEELEPGQIVFASRVYFENRDRLGHERGSAATVITVYPPRLNLSHELARRGAWCGSTCGNSETALGRALVMRELAWCETLGGPRYQIRFVDETPEEYESAAEAAAASQRGDG